MKKKSYHNATDKNEYQQAHSSELVKSQIINSSYFEKAYDFGYECFDDYLDYRFYKYQTSTPKESEVIKNLQCGVDGCIFQCVEEKELKKHKKFHNIELPYPCLNKNCKHQCETLNEWKRHMIQHCKSLYPCLKKDCSFVSTMSIEDCGHSSKHEDKGDNDRSLFIKKERKLCLLCWKLVCIFNHHRRVHPELCFTCWYPRWFTITVREWILFLTIFNRLWLF